MMPKLRGLLPYVALLLGAAYLCRAAGHFAYAARPDELGPDFWPRAVLVLLMGVCAYELVLRLVFVREPQASRAQDSSDGIEAQLEQDRRYPHLLMAGIGLTVLYVLGLETAGFFIATALYLSLFMLLGRYRRFGVIATTSVLGSLAFVFVFMKIVYVSLPLGVGPFKQISIWILAALGIR